MIDKSWNSCFDVDFVIKCVFKFCFSDIFCFWEDFLYGGYIGFGVNVLLCCVMFVISEVEIVFEKLCGENFNDEMKVSKFRLVFS